MKDKELRREFEELVKALQALGVVPNTFRLGDNVYKFDANKQEELDYYIYTKNKSDIDHLIYEIERLTKKEHVEDCLLQQYTNLLVRIREMGTYLGIEYKESPSKDGYPRYEKVKK